MNNDNMTQDINRLKVVLAEKNVLTNGYQNSWVKIKGLFQNGVLIPYNQIWRLWLQ